MPGTKAPLAAEFVDTHFVDEKYHERHSQLIHRHEDVLELLYVMQGSGSYIVKDREYPVQPDSLVVCNAGVLHGEPPFQRHNMQSYCCVLRGLSLPPLPPNTLMDGTHNPVLFFSADREAAENILRALHKLNAPGAEAPDVCGLLANALLNLVWAKLRRRQQPNEHNQQNKEWFDEKD